MTDHKLTLTAVICTFNRSRYLKRVLNSFLFQTAGSDEFGILVVDNNSIDDTKIIVENYGKKLKNLHYLFEPRQGLSFARNTAIKHCNNDILAFIDDDAIAHPNWVGNIIRTFQSDQSISIAGGKITIIWEDKRPGWLDDSLLSYYGHYDKGSKARFLPDNDFLFGGNIAFRSKLLKDLHFNTRLGMNGRAIGTNEETDLLMQLYANGFKSFYDPGIRVFHYARKDALTLRWIKKRISAQQKSHYQHIKRSDEKVLMNLLLLLRLFSDVLFVCKMLFIRKTKKNDLKRYFDFKTLYFRIRYHGVVFQAMPFHELKARIKNRMVKLIFRKPVIQSPNSVITDPGRFGHIDLINNLVINKTTDAIIAEKNGYQLHITGWALNAGTLKTADEVYLCVDSKEFKCSYGHDRPDVATHFKSEGVKSCGFSCIVPAFAFIEGWNEICLKVLSGGHVYEGIAATKVNITHLSEKFSNYKKQLEKSIGTSFLISAPFFQDPEVSIVISAIYSWEYIRLCLLSIISNTPHVSYEVLFLTHDPSDAHFKQIENCRIIQIDPRINLARTLNEAARVAKGEFLVYLDGLACVRSGWIEPLLSTFQSWPQSGLVGSKLMYHDGYHAGTGRLVTPTGENVLIGENYPSEHYEVNYVKEVPVLMEKAFIIRKNLFEKVNGFQDDFDNQKDALNDFTRRIRSSGLIPVYQPGSEIIIAKEHQTRHTGPGENGSDLTFPAGKLNKAGLDGWNDLSDQNFFYRDGSTPGKIVLYVDHCTPRIDQDGASFITFQYFKAMLAIGYKIILWPQDLTFEDPYTGILQQMGIEVVYGDVSFQEFIISHGKYIDFAFLAQPEGSLEYLTLIRKHSVAKILYMAHDLHFLRQMREKEAISTCDDLTIEQTRQLELELMRKSDVSLFFSEKEIDYLTENYPEISAINIPWIQEIRNLSGDDNFESRQGLLFVGAFGHLPNYDGIKWFHDEVFPLVVKQIPDISVIVIGSNPPDDILGLTDEYFLVTGYVKDIDPFFDKSRVFISPLRFGAGFKTKNARSMSHALPMVTTTIGAEGMKLTDGHNVLIADEAALFAKKVIELYTNNSLWKMLAVNSITHVADNYSFEKVQKFLSQKLLVSQQP